MPKEPQGTQQREATLFQQTINLRKEEEVSEKK